MIKELDVVVLTEAITEHGLKPGDLGTVVLVHNGAAFEVEFLMLRGETVAIATLEASQIRLAHKKDITHARSLRV